VNDLAQHVTQLFFVGFSPGVSLDPFSSAVLPKPRENLSIWREIAS
jgi:hypothetical protein